MMVGNLHDYYAARAARIMERDGATDLLPDVDRWRESRPRVHAQFMASLGIERLPERCDLRPMVTGEFEGEGYTAQKIAYQLMPDVWGSAHLYRPAALASGAVAPAVLYACGHHPAGVVGYQHHAIGWARRGYICLIFDTVEQHDNPGEHHGLHSGRLPQWISMGYTAAGGEVFNGIRALDLLLAQHDVDANRVGVTGISGGGSQSFRLAAADARLCAVATVAGVSDPAFAIPNRTVKYHCDCMYEHNRFARDAAVWGALIAPRPLLFCFARHDHLFTPQEFRDLHRRTTARYTALGVGERCRLIEYDGPHGYNRKSTFDAIHSWFDDHVAGDVHPEVDTHAIATSDDLHEESTLSVFHGVTPQPNYLDLLPDLLCRPAQIRLPESMEHWRQMRDDVIERLRREVFHLLDDVAEQQPLTQTGEWTKAGTDELRWVGMLDGMPQSVVQFDSAGGGPGAVVIGLGEREQAATAVAVAARDAAAEKGVSGLGIEPRGAGEAVPHPSAMNLLTREGCLVGLTPTMLMVQDLHHLWPQLLALPRVQGRAIYLYGRGEGAVAMLYHALLHPHPAVKGVILEGLPRSHADGVYPILGVRKVTDLAQAVGLLAPLPVSLVHRRGTAHDWYWALRAHARLTRPTTLTTAPSLAAAIAGMAASPPRPIGLS